MSKFKKFESQEEFDAALKEFNDRFYQNLKYILDQMAETNNAPESTNVAPQAPGPLESALLDQINTEELRRIAVNRGLLAQAKPQHNPGECYVCDNNPPTLLDYLEVLDNVKQGDHGVDKLMLNTIKECAKQIEVLKSSINELKPSTYNELISGVLYTHCVRCREVTESRQHSTYELRYYKPCNCDK